MAVDVRFAGAKKVEVGTVDEEDVVRHEVGCGGLSTRSLILRLEKFPTSNNFSSISRIG